MAGIRLGKSGKLALTGKHTGNVRFNPQERLLSSSSCMGGKGEMTGGKTTPEDVKG